MKQFWLVAAAALILVTLLSDGAFAQRGGFRGGGFGGGFRGGAIGGGFRGGAIRRRRLPRWWAWHRPRRCSRRRFSWGRVRQGLPQRWAWHRPRRPGLSWGRVRQGLPRRWAWLGPRRPGLSWGRVRQGLPCRRFSRRRLAPRMGLGLAGRTRPRPWRVELPLLRVVLLGPLHRLGRL